METLEAIRNAAQTIWPGFEFTSGRSGSTVDEIPYLTKLKETLGEQFEFEIAPDGHWYDFKVNGIHINLKLGRWKPGQADNAFSDRSIVFTWCGDPIRPTNGANMNQMWCDLASKKPLTERDPHSEYYYLAVNKLENQHVLKSILDINKYIPNPSQGNVMQICWKREFDNISYVCSDRRLKMLELIKTIQLAHKRKMVGFDKFITYDIDSLM